MDFHIDNLASSIEKHFHNHFNLCKINSYQFLLVPRTQWLDAAGWILSWLHLATIFTYCALHVLFICTKMSLTLWVDWLGGGAFLFKIASDIASNGSKSSFWIEKRGLSHLFLESGASKRKTSASRLQEKNTMRHVSHIPCRLFAYSTVPISS